MDIINEDDASIIEAKKHLDERKKDKDLIYEQKICLEYIEKLPKPTQTQAKNIIEELNKITILKPRYICLILNNLPDTEDEVNALFSKERTNLKKDEILHIVNIIKNHKK